jgi:hypothetical protein
MEKSAQLKAKFIFLFFLGTLNAVRIRSVNDPQDRLVGGFERLMNEHEHVLPVLL